MGNIYQAHRDPETWPDPEEFRPERFLDDDGNFVPNPAWMPFSTGRRACLGEAMANADMHLCITSIFQHFSVVPDPNGKELHGTYDFHCTPLAVVPALYKVLFRPRE